MSRPRKAASARARQRFVALELRVRKDDADLVRDVVAALADRGRASRARALLREHFRRPAYGLKALLAAAPLEAVDLERDRDVARDIDL